MGIQLVISWSLIIWFLHLPGAGTEVPDLGLVGWCAKRAVAVHGGSGEWPVRSLSENGPQHLRQPEAVHVCAWIRCRGSCLLSGTSPFSGPSAQGAVSPSLTAPSACLPVNEQREACQKTGTSLCMHQPTWAGGS